MDDSNTSRKQLILAQLLEERERRKQVARQTPQPVFEPEPVPPAQSLNDDVHSVASQQSKTESMVARMLEQRRAERSIRDSIQSMPQQQSRHLNHEIFAGSMSGQSHQTDEVKYQEALEFAKNQI